MLFFTICVQAKRGGMEFLMKEILIVGAGGCGREVLQWIKNINKGGKRWNIKGFLDDDLHTLESKICEVGIVAKIDDYEIQENDEFVCCIGNSKVRQDVVERLQKKGARFASVIHPSAIVADSCKIGMGAIIYPFALISDNAVIGNHCIINMYSSVAHDSVLGEYCTISSHCDVTGKCKLGDRVFMGTTSHVVPGSVIGNDVFICAGSTVMTRVRDGLKVLGNPAKIMKF
jgi:sugar O-acyltransferase, sialic acid O-acetyltransferase NeuD family